MTSAGAEGQEIKHFHERCSQAFADLMESHEFVRSAEHSHASRDYANEVYRRGERYMIVSANTHYRDAPSCCRIILGEGSLEFPEADWNHIALWQLAVSHGSPPPEGEPYPMRKVSALDQLLASMRADLEIEGADFLRGDLGAFYRARAELARSREPYKIYSPGPTGRYDSEDEPESVILQERFSREGHVE